MVGYFVEANACSHLRRTDSPLGLLYCNVILNYWGKGSSIPESAALAR